MPPIGLPEVLIIAFLIILFFGAKRLPSLVRGMADAVKEFKDGVKEEKSEPKKD